jgi:hypothetical protein
MMRWIEPGSEPLEGGRFTLQCASEAIEQWLLVKEEPSEELRTCKLCSKTWQDAVAHEICLGCFLLGRPDPFGSAP